jgi:hypothetical protein
MVSIPARGSVPTPSVPPVHDSDSSPETKPSPPPRLPSKVQAWLKQHVRQPPPKRARSYQDPLAPSPISSRLRPRGSVNLNESDLVGFDDTSEISELMPDRTASSLANRLEVNVEKYRKD